MPGNKENNVNFCEVDTADGLSWIPYEIRWSKRARYIRLGISENNNAMLVIPMRSSEKDALVFLKSKGDWIKKRLENSRPRQNLFQFLEKRPFLSANGKRLRTTFAFSEGKPKVQLNMEERTAKFTFPYMQELETPMRNALHAFAKRVISERAKFLAAKIGKNLNRVTVRDQSSLWGSCSGRGNISLNWRLVLLRPRLHDYIIWHELAHLTCFDHSGKFWELLNTYDPNAKTHNKEIGEITTVIMSLGR